MGGTTTVRKPGQPPSLRVLDSFQPCRSKKQQDATTATFPPHSSRELLQWAVPTAGHWWGAEPHRQIPGSPEQLQPGPKVTPTPHPGVTVLTDRLGRPPLQRGGSALLPRQGVLASVKALPGLASHLQVGLGRCQQISGLVPAPSLISLKLGWLCGARTAPFPAPAVHCEWVARAKRRDGDAVVPKALPVFRSGKCSGGSREVLGTGGRKVLSTGGDGPSASRGSGVLRGETTLSETFPPWATPVTPSGLSLAWDSRSACGHEGLSCPLPLAPTEGDPDLPCLGTKDKKPDGAF